MTTGSGPPGQGPRRVVPPYPSPSAMPAPPPPATRRTSRLAIWSMLLGVIGIVVPIFVAGIAALITARLGLRKIRRNPRFQGKEFAVAGAITGVIGIAISAVVLVWGIRRGQENARRIECASNLHTVGAGLLIYAVDHEHNYPDDLAALLKHDGLVRAATLVCPATRDTPAPGSTPFQRAETLHAGGHLSYIYVKGHTTRSPARAIVMYEPPTNHGIGANFLYADGHVEFHPAAEAKRMIAALEAGRK